MDGYRLEAVKTKGKVTVYSRRHNVLNEKFGYIAGALKGLGRRGVPVSNLPLLARTLGVSVEALIGEKTPPSRRGPTPKLQQQVERLSRLPQAKQRVVMEMLEGFLNQAARTG